MDNIYDLTMKSKGPNGEASTLILVEKFNPLLLKYSNKLNYDGAYTDILICFLEVIKKITDIKSEDIKKEQNIVSYIYICIKREYISLSKNICKINAIETELNEEVLSEDFDYNTIDESIFLKSLMDKLPNVQKKVVIEIFVKNKTQVQVAKDLGITRQAVNKSKNNAIKNLRKGYGIGGEI